MEHNGAVNPSALALGPPLRTSLDLRPPGLGLVASLVFGFGGATARGKNRSNWE